MAQPKENTDELAGALERLERLNRTVALLQSRISLLEAENTRYAEMLASRGVKTAVRSRVALELPPPIEAPLPDNDSAFAGMTGPERGLLDECRAGAAVFFLLKSDSKVDTGAWLSRAPVWVAALESELALFADGKRPWLAKVPCRNLTESFYNHITGELALAPAPGLAVCGFKMPPQAGYQALAQIYKATKEN